jgi:hypothetical protein
MPGAMVNEDTRVGNPLTTSREPVGPKRGGDKGSVGDQALMDAVLIVLIAWVFLFLVMFSLRRHNI